MTIFTKKEIEEIDKKYYDPHERAVGINSLLWPHIQKIREDFPPGPTNWDIACWALEFVGQTAFILNSDEMKDRIRHLSNAMYSIHYTHHRELLGPPDRIEA